MGARKIFVCQLHWTALKLGKEPGWYWWVAAQDPLYHGPFSHESDCRVDLAKVTKNELTEVIWR
jgi:hypothetical protein